MNSFYNIGTYNNTFYFSIDGSFSGREGTFGKYIEDKDSYVRLVLVPDRYMYVSIASAADQTGVTVSVNGGTFDATTEDAVGLYSTDFIYDSQTVNSVVVKFPDLSDYPLEINAPSYDLEVPSSLSEDFHANIVPGFPGSRIFIVGLATEEVHSTVTLLGQPCSESSTNFWTVDTPLNIADNGNLFGAFVVDSTQLTPFLVSPAHLMLPKLESIQIPAGKYDSEAYISAFVASMGAAGVIVTGMAVNPLTQKMQFATDLKLLYYEWLPDTIGSYNPHAYVLGISNDKYKSIESIPFDDYTNSFVGDALPDLRGPSEVYVHVSPMGLGFTNDSFGATLEDIVDVVPIDVCFGCSVNYVNPDSLATQVQYKSPVNLSNLRVQLKDGYGNVLDSNGTAVTLVFSITSK